MIEFIVSYSEAFSPKRLASAALASVIFCGVGKIEVVPKQFVYIKT